MTMTYAWYVNGGAIAATTSMTGSSFSKSDKVECEVKPYDGSEYGTAVKSNQVIIGNAAPAVASVTLTPSPAYEGSTMTCTPGTTKDGDTVTIKYEWFVNGTLTSTASSKLSGTSFDKGDRVYCRITPFDGTDDGTALTSSTVTISNTAPTATSVRISPNPSNQADTLICNYAYSDVDGDVQSGTKIEWTVTNASGTATSYTRNSLSGVFSRSDKVTCAVTPKDGIAFGSVVTSPALTISNTAPIASAMFIRPNPARRGDTLSCGYSYFDADGDTESGTSIEWTVTTPGGAVSTYTRTTLSGVFKRNDNVVCAVTPKDGTSAGVASSSGALKIANTAPVATSVSVNPNPARQSDTLTCNYSYTDVDGDAKVERKCHGL